MNMKEKYVDDLTRQLLQSAAENPSPALHRSIMGRILQEMPYGYKEEIKVKMKKVSYIPFIWLSIALYIIVIACLSYLPLTEESGRSEIITNIQEGFPYILFCSLIIGSLLFYSVVDKLFTLNR